MATLLGNVIEKSRGIKLEDNKENATLLSSAANNDIPKVKMNMNKDIVNTLITEAVGEGPKGMEFVYDVMRNQADFFKKPMKFVIDHYYAGPKRKDLKEFVAKQPKESINVAQDIANSDRRGMAKESLHFITEAEAKKLPSYIVKEGGYIPLTKVGNHIGLVTLREYYILRNQGKLPPGLEARVIER